ncbi:MAG: signal peptidase II [Elusimicrobia bacterium]|nr:signal peptidase II [Elusimicrobiota bacterium]
MTRFKRALLLRPAVLLGVFVADRLTKLWAMERLAPLPGLPLLPFFHLTYVENTGAAFGIGRSRNGFFVALTLALLGLLCFMRRRWPREDRWLESGFLLVAAGALGNLYDRLAYGFVVDFLDFRVWPVFNVADSCVTVGACCLAWGLSRLEKEKPGRS